MKPGSPCEAVQIGHPVADNASQRNVTMESTGDVLAVEGVHKSFGANEILKWISLAPKKHEVISILGSSGSGTCARAEGVAIFHCSPGKLNWMACGNVG